MDSKGGHVAVFTFPFTSHPFVMFNLIESLAVSAPNIWFSFFNTPRSNKILFSAKNPEAVGNIRVYDLDDGDAREGSNLLQEGNCFLKVLPGNFRRGLKIAETLTGQRITCFLTDAFFASAVADMAEERNAPWIGLWVPAPYALPAFLQLSYIQQVFENAEWQKDLELDIIPGTSPVRYLDLPCRELIEPSPDWMEQLEALFLPMVQNIHRASMIVSNSFRELNPDALVDHLKSKFRSFLFLGTLTLSESRQPSLQDKTGCLSWLDGQKPETVAYISFGTGIGCPAEEFSALAESLDAFGVPFLWVLNDESKSRLPSGFLKNGKIVPWAPQSRVLKHPSVGVYVTHCGYNSVLESIMGGVPMICRSVWTDNHMTAKMVEEIWEIGVRVEAGKFTKKAMMQSLETIFRSEKGKKIKENVSKLK